MAGRPAAAALGGAYTDEHHQEFMERGFIHLGQLLPPAELGALSERLDEVMLGSVSYEGVTFQLDPGGAYTRSDMGPWEGASTEYRRIEGLECDPLVAAFSQHPLVTQIHARYYGDTVRARRPIMMNKPAGRSTPLPWHQVSSGPHPSFTASQLSRRVAGCAHRPALPAAGHAHREHLDRDRRRGRGDGLHAHGAGLAQARHPQRWLLHLRRQHREILHTRRRRACAGQGWAFCDVQQPDAAFLRRQLLGGAEPAGDGHPTAL